MPPSTLYDLGADKLFRRGAVDMGDVVNLNQFRKKRDRKDANEKASRNRIRHGRTKAEKKAEQKKHDISARELDRKKLPSKPRNEDAKD